jgi:hypothetical protein
MLDHRPTHVGPTIVDSDALACMIDIYLRANPEPKLSRCVFDVFVNAFAQLLGSSLLPPEAEFWNPNTMLPSKMRDEITLFERELDRCNGHMMTLVSSRFVGMMERDPESIYDLLSMTPKDIDFESDSEGSLLTVLNSHF